MLKFSILYSWFVRNATFFLPDFPFVMRFRGWLYSFMMRECGSNFQVCSSAYINSLSGMVVGSDVYLGPRVTIIAVDLEVGDEVIIGPGAVISGANHVFENGSFRFAKSMNIKTRIHNGAWVAANAVVTSGSSLPEQSILGAGAVLTKVMEAPRAIYVGCPAKFLKFLDG